MTSADLALVLCTVVLDCLDIGWRFRRSTELLAKFVNYRIPAGFGRSIWVCLANERKLVDALF